MSEIKLEACAPPSDPETRDAKRRGPVATRHLLHHEPPIFDRNDCPLVFRPVG